MPEQADTGHTTGTVLQDVLRAAGYGDKWIFFYNNNAIVEFANSHKLDYSAWGEWKRQDPLFIARHARDITVLVACEARGGA